MSRHNHRSRTRSKSDDLIMNYNIKSDELRVVGEDGEKLDILSKEEALRISEDRGLDLVLISPTAKPPVAKIMDYGKYKYKLEKKKKDAKKNQKNVDVKEIKLSCKIADNDLNYKLKHSIKFLEQGKHLKIRMFLKGREMSNPELGIKVLNRAWSVLEDYGILEQEAKRDGRYINMYIVPLK